MNAYAYTAAQHGYLAIAVRVFGSLGGKMALYAAAFEPRIRANVELR